MLPEFAQNSHGFSGIEVKCASQEFVSLNGFDVIWFQGTLRKILDILSYDMLSAALDCCSKNMQIAFIGQR